MGQQVFSVEVETSDGVYVVTDVEIGQATKFQAAWMAGNPLVIRNQDGQPETRLPASAVTAVTICKA
jgi:hypothetical protein